MNCSEALLEAVAKYAFEIGLKPLIKIELISTNQIRGSNAVLYRRSKRYTYLLENKLEINLLLLAEFAFVIEQLQAVENVFHCDQRIGKVL